MTAATMIIIPVIMIITPVIMIITSVIMIITSVIMMVEGMVTLVIIIVSVTSPVIMIIKMIVTSAMAWKLYVLQAVTQSHLDLSVEGGVVVEVIIFKATPAQDYNE